MRWLLTLAGRMLLKDFKLTNCGTVLTTFGGKRYGVRTFRLSGRWMVMAAPEGIPNAWEGIENDAARLEAITGVSPETSWGVAAIARATVRPSLLPEQWAAVFQASPETGERMAAELGLIDTALKPKRSFDELLAEHNAKRATLRHDTQGTTDPLGTGSPC